MLPAFQSFANLSVVSPGFRGHHRSKYLEQGVLQFASKDSPEQAAEIIGMTKRFAYSLSKSENEGESAQNLRATPQGNATKGGGFFRELPPKRGVSVTPDQLKSIGMARRLS